MKKHTKEQTAALEKISDALMASSTELADAIDALNDTMLEKIAVVNEKLEAYNAFLAEARELRDTILEAMTEYRDGRSEKWAEGDAGSQYASWIDVHENLELDDVEIEEPETLEPPDFSVILDFQDLPPTPDGA